MLHVDLTRWNQTASELYQLSLHADHVRTRERFSALYQMVIRNLSASEVAEEIGRENETVMGWVKTDNELGPAALEYHRTGGRRPFWEANRSST